MIAGKLRLFVYCIPYLALSLANAHATDLCLPIRGVMRWEGEKAPAIYQSCLRSNDLYNEIDHDLGIKAFHNLEEVNAFLPVEDKKIDANIAAKSQKWLIKLNERVRQDSAAMALLKSYRATMEKLVNKGEPLADSLAKLNSAIAAQEGVAQKGILLKKFLLLANADFHTAEELERAFQKFLYEENPVFKIPEAAESSSAP